MNAFGGVDGGGSGGGGEAAVGEAAEAVEKLRMGIGREEFDVLD